MLIRIIKDKDREKIRKIVIESDMFTEEEINVAMELVDEFLVKGEESGYEIYVAVDDNDEILGYVCFGKRPLTQWTFDIYWIVVDRTLQRSGIGKKLMNFVEHAIKDKGGRLVLVETSSQDKYLGTRLFYVSCGYNEVASIKDFYKEGDNLVIFAKYI